MITDYETYWFRLQNCWSKPVPLLSLDEQKKEEEGEEQGEEEHAEGEGRRPKQNPTKTVISQASKLPLGG